ncbi:hypothetical protein DM02DRAFT_147789 [Periconia macrospinosa]|uniref:DUF7730 domain-containing protein n=1 Tax=Periconia macrospinosa TaxID=97972 RepID=A0A2V1DBM4_9PLEO|nr:hypothetical protein DM02DRAFT_147789 [Periconia macrospinosa]
MFRQKGMPHKTVDTLGWMLSRNRIEWTALRRTHEMGFTWNRYCDMRRSSRIIEKEKQKLQKQREEEAANKNAETFPFLSLPPELRNQVYAYYFSALTAEIYEAEKVQENYTIRRNIYADMRDKDDDDAINKYKDLAWLRNDAYGQSHPVFGHETFPLLLTNHEIHAEALTALYASTAFALTIDEEFANLSPPSPQGLAAVPYGWDLSRIRSLTLRIDLAAPCHTILLPSHTDLAFDFSGLKEMVSLTDLRIVVMGWRPRASRIEVGRDGSILDAMLNGRFIVDLGSADDWSAELGELVSKVMEGLPEERRERVKVAFGLSEEEIAALEPYMAFSMRPVNRVYVVGSFIERSFNKVCGGEKE